ncbi:MAG: hypothetical protein AMXMBFR20_16410 [Planctomycetia bacterium]|jgi:glutathione synthase/RimK-type ligase-like ATP-grasp enzyme
MELSHNMETCPEIAIHHCEGSYSDRWLEYCCGHRVPHRIVNCYDSDIISQLAGCGGLLWQWKYGDPRDVLAALRVIRAAEAMGLVVFPNSATCEHYDDKVGQKYLLEAIGAELAPTFVFYDKESALKWVASTKWPKVFKLSRGAGSQNVQLIHSAAKARKLVNRAFGAGFRSVASGWGDARSKLAKHRRKGDIWPTVKRLPKTLREFVRLSRQMPRERGYIYFQEFLPNNEYDTRITVIGNRAFGYLRMVRADDFRASGSGLNVFDQNQIDPRCIESAFRIARRLGTQALAFDYIKGPSESLILVEISYTFLADFIYECPGYWDPELKWHEGHYWPQDVILQDLIKEVNAKPARTRANAMQGLGSGSGDDEAK